MKVDIVSHDHLEITASQDEETIMLVWFATKSDASVPAPQRKSDTTRFAFRSGNPLSHTMTAVVQTNSAQAIYGECYLQVHNLQSAKDTIDLGKDSSNALLMKMDKANRASMSHE
jgi:hypothetical protein